MRSNSVRSPADHHCYQSSASRDRSTGGSLGRWILHGRHQSPACPQLLRSTCAFGDRAVPARHRLGLSEADSCARATLSDRCAHDTAGAV